MRPLVTVIIPAFNEDDVITDSLATILGHVQQLEAFRFELIVVDDGSRDSTRATAEAFAAQHPHEVRVAHHPTNRKLGGALRTGIAASSGDYIVVLDADLSYSVDHVERLLAALITNRAAIAVASPYMAGGSSIAVPRKLLVRSRAANRWLSVTAQEPVHTLTGMVRAYEGPWLRALPIKAEDVDVNVEILYKAMLLRAPIVEVPATLDWSRLAHRTKRSAIVTSQRDRWNTYRSLVAGFIFRPFLFPFIPGLASLVVGFALFLLGPGTGKVTLLGLSGMIVGALLCWQALPLLQAKRYFEEGFLATYRVQRTLERKVGDGAPAVAPFEERPTSALGREPDRRTQA